MSRIENSRAYAFDPIRDVRNHWALSSLNRENNGLPQKMKNFYHALSSGRNYSSLKERVDLKKRDLRNKFTRHHLYIAFVYAMQMSEAGRSILSGDSPVLYDPNAEGWRKAVEIILEDDEASRIFAEKVETNMQAVSPSLAPSIRLVINKLNKENKPLRIYDLGCGQNFDLPIIASNDNTGAVNFTPPGEIAGYNHAVNLEEGIGVDDNPSDLEWSKCCTLSWNPTAEAIARWDKVTPLRVKLRDSDSRIRVINRSAIGFVPEKDKEADFVITKKMRYELPNQDGIRQTILTTLKDGGYYISIGEEEIIRRRATDKNYDPALQDVWVFQKQGDRLIPVIDRPVMMVPYSGQIGDDGYDKTFF